MSARLMKNAASLLAAGVIEKAAYFVLFAFLARFLPKEDFGIYSLVLTLFFIGGILCSFGMEPLVIREIAANRENASAIYSGSLAIAFVLSVLAWPAMTGLAILLDYDPRVLGLLAPAGIIFVFTGLTVIAASVLRAYERMEILAAAGILYSVLFVASSVASVLAGWGLTGLISVMVVLEILRSAGLTCVIHRRFPLSFEVPDRSSVLRLLRLVVPFALLTAYSVLLHRTDTLMLGWLKGLPEVAVYSTASKILDAMALLSSSMIGALYPALSNRFSMSREESWSFYSNSIAVFAVLAFFVAPMVFLVSPGILGILFGPSYLSAAAALRWLSAGFLFSVLGGPAGTLLLAAGDRMASLLALCTVVLAGNVLLNLVLVPLHGVEGAAAATCLSMLIGFAGRLVLTRGYFKRFPDYVRIAWRPFAAGTAMTAALWALRDGNVFLVASGGFLLYVGILSALGEFGEPRYDSIREKCRGIGRAVKQA